MTRYVVSWLGVGLALVVFGCGQTGPATTSPSATRAEYTTQQVTEAYCREQYNACMRQWGDDYFGRRLCSERNQECRRNIPSPFVFDRPYVFDRRRVIDRPYVFERPYVAASVRRVRFPLPTP